MTQELIQPVHNQIFFGFFKESTMLQQFHFSPCEMFDDILENKLNDE